MKFGCKPCWALTLILIAALGLGAFKFIIQGSTAGAADGRTAVIVLPHERDTVLGEMRGMLEAVQEIADAIARGDMQGVVDAATPVGIIATQNESPAFMGKLPLELKLQGHATHEGFDNLAALASTGADQITLVAALADHLSKCTGCHAGYRFDAEE